MSLPNTTSLVTGGVRNCTPHISYFYHSNGVMGMRGTTLSDPTILGDSARSYDRFILYSANSLVETGHYVGYVTMKDSCIVPWLRTYYGNRDYGFEDTIECDQIKITIHKLNIPHW